MHAFIGSPWKEVVQPPMLTERLPSDFRIFQDRFDAIGNRPRLPMPNPLHTRQYAQFLDELRAARVRSGMSQTELAKLMGEHQTFVSKCELGTRRLDVVELKRWTDALGVGLVGFV